MGIDRDRYLTAEVAGETFVLDEQTGASFRLGGSGSRLWHLLAEGSSVEEAARLVAERTHADYERVLSDARSFVAELNQLGVDVGH